MLSPRNPFLAGISCCGVGGVGWGLARALYVCGWNHLACGQRGSPAHLPNQWLANATSAANYGGAGLPL